jgi:hypothetical protein
MPPQERSEQSADRLIARGSPAPSRFSPLWWYPLSDVNGILHARLACYPNPWHENGTRGDIDG